MVDQVNTATVDVDNIVGELRKKGYTKDGIVTVFDLLIEECLPGSDRRAAFVIAKEALK